MKKDYTNTFIINTLNLPIIKDIWQLSDIIGLSTTIIFLLSTYNTRYYNKFYINKKDGTKREILSPSYSMKLVQRWLLEKLLYKIEISENAFAYRKNFGNAIKKNADIHKHSLYLMEIDIKDFFTSIKKDRVFYFFRNIGYNTLIANILANICTYNNYLPQGAVTSPYLSNILCYKLDRRLMGLCGKRDIIYTRYADDLTFSCDNKDILRKTKNIIYDIIKEESFEINEKKTRFLSPKSRKSVTGITVNDGKLKAPKEMKRNVRAMIHRAIISKDYSEINRIKGYIAYISSIEDSYVDKVQKYINGFQSKNIACCHDIINSFNQNKILKDTPDLEIRNP